VALAAVALCVAGARTPAQLGPGQFAQVHCAVVVNLGAIRGVMRRAMRRVIRRVIRRVMRGDNETADIEFKGRPERLLVSRSFLQLFQEM
jgi:DNA-binding LytR/AlgR family response regulator